ncbi:hypothetical protein REC12_02395 [Desulfosporosinus sp. PR]|uniref:hypothetical protein n=1 Tax=Candidatus Desulfosporosinus nitrosoreducens TaxID=3401928 RepID=UPI0027FD4BDB|nr:hypothetical protein [Desulfosporosinus sp. PR]MDQ7092442.1 hypothetical protein [Desulfosporosinus sp. PR]
MKKFICMGLVILMTIFCAVPVYAVEGTNGVKTKEGASPQFTYISFLDAGLAINSSGLATCAGDVTLYYNSYSTNMTVQLQKSSGSGWSTIKTWTSSGTGIAGTDLEGYYYVVSGTYRVCTTANVYDPSGKLVEIQSAYSDNVTY